MKDFVKPDPRIDIWRQKAADGSLTFDDVKEYIDLLRQGRNLAYREPAKKKSVKPKPTENIDDKRSD